MRLRHRVFASYLLVSLVLVLVVGGFLYDTLSDEVRAGIDDRVDTGVELLAVELARLDGPAEPAGLDARLDALAAAMDARLTVVAPSGQVVADSEFDGAGLAGLDNHAAREEVREARAAGEGRSVRYSRSVGADLLYRARRVDGGPWSGSVVRMAVPLTRVEAAQDAARRELLGALVLALGIAAVAGALLARRLSGPIAELGRAAERVRQGDLAARARVETGDELEDLARALEAARDQLAARIAEASAERDRLEGVLHGMVEGVMVTDGDGRVILANRALQAIFGLDRPVTGRTVIETVRNPDVAQALREAGTGRDGAEVAREITLSWPSETTLTLHAARLADGGVVAVFHDTTMLKRVDAIRRDFVANVSHELQTPLATLGGYAEVLFETPAEPGEVQESAGVIRRNVARLSAIVADLLELSRLEAAGFEPRREDVRVDELVEDLAAEWAPHAAAAGQELAADADRGVVVRADRGLLRQALVNLLENAVKHCPRGTSIRLEARAAERGAVFMVADTGPGIPYDDQVRVFERFYRVDKGRSRETGGTGLGLSIVKHVAEVHGGTVAVDSIPGAGASFRLTIPG